MFLLYARYTVNCFALCLAHCRLLISIGWFNVLFLTFTKNPACSFISFIFHVRKLNQISNKWYLSTFLYSKLLLTRLEKSDDSALNIIYKNLTLFSVIWMSLSWTSERLLNCKHIENMNASFCMHNWGVKNAITWPLLWVCIHTIEVLWMRQSKTLKILLNLIIIILANTINIRPP